MYRIVFRLYISIKSSIFARRSGKTYFGFDFQCYAAYLIFYIALYDLSAMDGVICVALAETQQGTTCSVALFFGLYSALWLPRMLFLGRGQ